jgi:hypothetical protein
VADEACRSAGAPIPEVLQVDTLPPDSDEREVMIQRAVPGCCLSDIQNSLSRGELAHVWAQAGEALVSIHSVPAGGFYKMREPGVGDFPDWVSISQSPPEARQRDVDELRQRGVPSSDLEALAELLDTIHLDDFQGGRRIIDLANLGMRASQVDLQWLHAGYSLAASCDSPWPPARDGRMGRPPDLPRSTRAEF